MHISQGRIYGVPPSGFSLICLFSYHISILFLSYLHPSLGENSEIWHRLYNTVILYTVSGLIESRESFNSRKLGLVTGKTGIKKMSSWSFWRWWGQSMKRPIEELKRAHFFNVSHKRANVSLDPSPLLRVYISAF